MWGDSSVLGAAIDPDIAALAAGDDEDGAESAALVGDPEGTVQQGTIVVLRVERVVPRMFRVVACKLRLLEPLGRQVPGIAMGEPSAQISERVVKALQVLACAV